MNGLHKLPIEKYKIRRRNLKQPQEPAGYFMSPESGPQDTVRGAINAAAADENGRVPVAGGRLAPNIFRVLPAILVTLGFLSVGMGQLWPTSVPAQAKAPLVRVLHTDGSSVNSLAFSRNGRLLLSGSLSTSRLDALRLWDVGTGRLLRVFPESGLHDGGAALSPDGKLAASVHLAVRLWDTETGRFVRTMATESGAAMCCFVVFSPDGRLLAGEDLVGTARWVRLWEVGTGRLVGRVGGAGYHPGIMGFSPDGRTLAVAGGEPGSWRPGLDLWDVGTGHLIRRLTSSGLDTQSLTFSPDGAVLATVGNWRAFSTVILWDSRTGQQIDSPLYMYPPGPGGMPSKVAYSPDGRLLAIAWIAPDNGPQVIKLWGTKPHTTVLTLRGEDARSKWVIDALAFSPDGTLLAIGAGRDIMLWDVRKVLTP